MISTIILCHNQIISRNSDHYCSHYNRARSSTQNSNKFIEIHHNENPSFLLHQFCKQKYAHEICYSRWQVIALTKSAKGFEFNMLNEKIVPVCVKKGNHLIMTDSREEVPHGENIRE